jgi:hypothetical protein
MWLGYRDMASLTASAHLWLFSVRRTPGTLLAAEGEALLPRTSAAGVADAMSEAVAVSPCMTEGRCMARGRTTALTLTRTPAERRTLLAWQRATTISAGRARRGRIILLVADGVPITAIAATVGIDRRFVYKWVRRFLAQGVEGLADKPGRGSWRVPSQGTPEGAARHEAAVG